MFQELPRHIFSSARVDILARYGTFFSYEVVVLANIVGRDVRSTTGSNLKLLEKSSGLNPWIYSSARLKMELIENEKVEVPNQDSWRVSYLCKLIEQKQNFHYLGEQSMVHQVSDLIDCLCIN